MYINHVSNGEIRVCWTTDGYQDLDSNRTIQYSIELLHKWLMKMSLQQRDQTRTQMCHFIK